MCFVEFQYLCCQILRPCFPDCREQEPDWDREIREDVRDECSKYGEVMHIFVDRNSKVRLTRSPRVLPLVCADLKGWTGPHLNH